MPPTDAESVGEVLLDVVARSRVLGVDPEQALRQAVRSYSAQVREIDGVRGTRFAVWAPNASRVSVIGDFNDWDGRRHMMRLHPANGIWEIFIPDIGPGRKYKFEMLDRDGHLLPLKGDPFARYNEPPPGNASIVYDSGYDWQDSDWMQRRNPTPDLDKPVSIYEVHLGSWRRKEHNQYLSYRELANELVVRHVLAHGVPDPVMVGLYRVRPEIDREFRLDSQQIGPLHGPDLGEFLAVQQLVDQEPRAAAGIAIDH